MGTLSQILLFLLMSGSILLAVVLLMVSWGLAVLVLATSSLTFLVLGAAAARREARDVYWRTRRCAACGLGVPSQATRCPSCRSADFVTPRHVLQRDRPAEKRHQGQATAERERDAERSNRELGLFAVPFIYFGRYVALLQSGFGTDPSNPTEMRWWAVAMVHLTGLFATVGVATHFESWGPGLLVLVGTLVAGVAVAQLGPRAMEER
ncbi:MAG TPA: hypothetical protein VHS99_11205 [Chloroflexota bacterium]|nr:hypothetical protein [Chloroflexota bacterium]